jgi:hypothetical protein
MVAAINAGLEQKLLGYQQKTTGGQIKKALIVAIYFYLITVFLQQLVLRLAAVVN